MHTQSATWSMLLPVVFLYSGDPFPYQDMDPGLHVGWLIDGHSFDVIVEVMDRGHLDCPYVES